MKKINEYIKYHNSFFRSDSSLMRLYLLLLIFVCSIGACVLLKSAFLIYTSFILLSIGVYDFLNDVTSPIATDEEINYACGINNSIKEKLIEKLNNGIIIRRGYVLNLLRKNEAYKEDIIRHQKNSINNLTKDHNDDI